MNYSKSKWIKLKYGQLLTEPNKMKSETGYLSIILGPMFSGKTTSLITNYRKICNDENNIENVCVINYIDDVRYHDTMLSSHDLDMIPCIMTKKMGDIWSTPENPLYEKIHNSKYILINEAQFFEDLFDIICQMLSANKKVYIYGLDGDFKRQKFGKMLDLIPLCDQLTKLTAICNMCKSAAIFSHRITQESSQIVIGSTNYVPLCRKCYTDCSQKK